ncbi:MAG: alpha-E domain-containing protein [Saprospiraceae bacterium]
MLSRVANSIYWMGRYLERAENYARFMDVNFNLMLDLPRDQKEQWLPLIQVTGDYGYYSEHYTGYDRNDIIHFMAFDESNPNSIISSVSKARENAREIRENIIKETWEKLNELFHYVNGMAKSNDWMDGDPIPFFTGVKEQILLINGIGFATVARTESWYFRLLGMFLERADKTSRIVDVKYHILLPSPALVGSPMDYLHWSALLKSVSGFNTYRRLYGNLEASKVVEFLILNDVFPRSVFHCITEAEICLRNISGKSSRGFTNSSEKTIGALRSKLEFTSVNEIIDFGLHQYIDQLQSKITDISNNVNDTFFQLKNNFASQNSMQE